MEIINVDVKNITFHGGIHTLEVGVDKKIGGRGITSCGKRNYIQFDEGHGAESHIYHINLNKWKFGNNKYFDSWSEYKRSFRSLIETTGVNRIRINRADFRVDSYDYRFNDLFQFNNAVAIAIGMQQGWNRSPLYTPYESIMNMTNQRGLEAYCYKRPKDGLTKTRYEFRCFGLPFDDFTMLSGLGVVFWFLFLYNMTLDDSLFERVQKAINEKLMVIWENEKENGKYTFNEFARRHKRYILKTSQLVSLAISCGCTKKSAYEIKAKENIACISQEDFREYIRRLIKGLLDFFIE